MKALLAAVALLALSSCGGPTEPCDGLWTVGPEFTADEFAFIQTAGARWTEFAGAPMSLERGRALTCQIIRTPRVDAVAGLTSQRGNWANIQIRIGADDPSFLNVVTHELGHGLGLQHVADPDAIMHLGTSPESHFTDADRAECARVRCFR